MTLTKHTKYGFDFGMLRVERLWEQKGRVCVRVINRVSGKFVDVETTPLGRKQYVQVGSLDASALLASLAEGNL